MAKQPGQIKKYNISLDCPFYVRDGPVFLGFSLVVGN